MQDERASQLLLQAMKLAEVVADEVRPCLKLTCYDRMRFSTPSHLEWLHS